MAVTGKDETLESVFRAVRLCFGNLRVIGDALHADIGITSAMRAVMESLAPDHAATVPEIARSKLVSRQNVQVLVDALAAKRMVETRPNPAHKRSPLVALTPLGRETFDAMRQREAALLAELAGDIPAAALDETLATLTALLRRLESESSRTNRPAS